MHQTFMCSALYICSEGRGLCCKGLVNQTSTINLKGYQERRKRQKSQAEHKLMQGSIGNRTWDLSCSPMAQLPLSFPQQKHQTLGLHPRAVSPQELQASPVCCCAASTGHTDTKSNGLSTAESPYPETNSVYLYLELHVFIYRCISLSPDSRYIPMHVYTSFYTLYIV